MRCRMPRLDTTGSNEYSIFARQQFRLSTTSVADQKKDPRRARFTIAHELAHICQELLDYDSEALPGRSPKG